MVIALDTRPLHNQSAVRGIGVYTSSLIKQFKQIPNLEIIEISKGRVSDGIDLIHYPWFDFYFRTLPLSAPLPTVVTIHDVTPLVLKDFYPPGIKGRLNFQIQKYALKKVQAVITDSEVSRLDVINYLPVAENKVVTIHLAPQEGLISHPITELKHKVIQKYQLYDPYILYVGDVNRNKNLITLVEACVELKIKLLIVGKQAVNTDYDHSHIENQDLVTLQTKYSKNQYIKTPGFVSVEELSALYNLAEAYCQPSLYEGFGVPILEAMRCGCPVIASKQGSLPEIGGSATIYTEPTREKLIKTINFVQQLSETQRIRLIQEGRKQAQKFSWKTTAQKTHQVYRDILNPKS
jgi:glycosyltransferase involved in cell wall biosynthesis